jgi:osmotically inducible protein OsmC
MALSNALAQAGHAPDAVDTRAEVDLTMDGGPTINAIRLETKARVPGMDAAQFRAIADDAKQNCPVSKALSAVPITLKAELLG